MRPDHPSPSDSQRPSGTASPSAAEFRGRGPRTTTGAVASVVLATGTVTAVLAPVVLAVVLAATVTGGAFLGVATDVGRVGPSNADRSATGSDAR